MHRSHSPFTARLTVLFTSITAVALGACQADGELARLGTARSGGDAVDDALSGADEGIDELASGAAGEVDDGAPESCNTCASISGFEGRCLSPGTTAAAGLGLLSQSLPQSTCADTDRCVPCFDPFTGETTGACGIACEAAPAQPAETFPTCCLTGGTDLGHCVPTEAVTPDQASSFGQAGCGTYDLCIPDVFAAGPRCPQPPAGLPIQAGELCTTSAAAQSGGGASAQGVCLPSCMPMAANAPIDVGQEACADGHRCVPCEQDGVPTGACTPTADCDGHS